ADERVVLGITEGPQGQHRVGHGREDYAQASRHGQALLEPAQRRRDGAPPEWSRAQALPALEGVVHADEEILPDEAFRRERAGDARKTEACVLAGHGP